MTLFKKPSQFTHVFKTKSERTEKLSYFFSILQFFSTLPSFYVTVRFYVKHQGKSWFSLKAHGQPTRTSFLEAVVVKCPALFELSVTSDLQSPRLHSAGPWRTCSASRKKETTGQVPGWELKDLPPWPQDRQSTGEQPGCIFRQNASFKKETHFKSGVFTAGKLMRRYTNIVIQQPRKWLSGRGQECKDRVGRRDFKLPIQWRPLTKTQKHKNQNQDSGLRGRGEVSKGK